jgi:hypothetical protein
MDSINLRQLFLYNKGKTFLAQLRKANQNTIIENEVKNYVVVNISLRDMK